MAQSGSNWDETWQSNYCPPDPGKSGLQKFTALWVADS